MDIIIELPEKVHREINKHLLPPKMHVEEVAFVFAELAEKEGQHIFNYKSHLLLQPEEFVFQSSYYFELKDETSARIIKNAHDLKTSVIEFHSHVDQEFARFSHTDWSGFLEFVPHIFWRL